MHVAVWWVLHVLGTDDASGPWYLWWSGFFADIALFGSLVGLVATTYLKHNCHVRGCPLIGRHPVEGTPFVVCGFHHPHGAPTHEQVLRLHRHRRGQAAGAGPPPGTAGA